MRLATAPMHPPTRSSLHMHCSTYRMIWIIMFFSEKQSVEWTAAELGFPGSAAHAPNYPHYPRKPSIHGCFNEMAQFPHLALLIPREIDRSHIGAHTVIPLLPKDLRVEPCKIPESEQTIFTVLGMMIARQTQVEEDGCMNASSTPRKCGILLINREIIMLCVGNY